MISIALIQVVGVQAQEVNYGEHIQPIIQAHCVKCHRPESIGPMPFRDYSEVSSYGQMIKFMTSSGYMPPDRARTSGVSYEHQDRLTKNEIQLIQQWVDGGMKEGPQVNDCSYETTSLPDYDVEIKMAERFEQYDIYFDQFQVFVIPYDLGQDKLVQSIEFVPGVEQIVRSCQVSVALDTSVLSQDRWDPRYGYNSFGGVGDVPELSHWYCWNAPDRPWHDLDHPKYLPAKGYLLFHIFYGPTSDRVYDQSSIRLKFAENQETPQFVSPFLNREVLTITPEQFPAHEVTNLHAKVVLPMEIELFEIYPQFNLLCHSLELYVKYPGQKKANYLLKIPEWDFMWRKPYRFTNAIHLPAGTEIHAFVQYDNTDRNVSLPNAVPVDIGWGDHMFGETFLFHFTYSTLSPENNQDKTMAYSVTLSEPNSAAILNDWLDSSRCVEVFNWQTGEKNKLSFDGLEQLHALPPGNYTFEIFDDRSEQVEARVITKLY